MQPDAPILHDYLRTKGVKGADKPTNVVERYELGIGDVEAGFREADVIVEREFDTKPMHQGYIEPQGCVATTTEDGQIEVWCCTQAPWVVPRPPLQHPQDRHRKDPRHSSPRWAAASAARPASMPEPIAIQLSRKAKRPVKIVLTRNEVFRATGPVSGTKSRIKIGCKKDGTITAAEAELVFQTGAFTGSAVHQCAAGDVHALRRCKNVKTVVLRGRVEPPEGELVPRALRAAGRVRGRGRDRRAGDARSAWTRSTSGSRTPRPKATRPSTARRSARSASSRRCEARKKCDHYKSPVPAGQGRGVACGLLVQPRRRDHRHAEHRHRRLGDAHPRHSPTSPARASRSA